MPWRVSDFHADDPDAAVRLGQPGGRNGAAGGMVKVVKVNELIERLGHLAAGAADPGRAAAPDAAEGHRAVRTIQGAGKTPPTRSVSGVAWAVG